MSVYAELRSWIPALPEGIAPNSHPTSSPLPLCALRGLCGEIPSSAFRLGGTAILGCALPTIADLGRTGSRSSFAKSQQLPHSKPLSFLSFPFCFQRVAASLSSSKRSSSVFSMRCRLLCKNMKYFSRAKNPRFSPPASYPSIYPVCFLSIANSFHTSPFIKTPQLLSNQSVRNSFKNNGGVPFSQAKSLLRAGSVFARHPPLATVSACEYTCRPSNHPNGGLSHG